MLWVSYEDALDRSRFKFVWRVLFNESLITPDLQCERSQTSRLNWYKELDPNRSVLPLNQDLIKDRQLFVSTYWRHPWDQTLRTLPKSRMTKQGNFTQRTPQAKKQSDQASKQVSKQASGSTNAPHDLVFPATGPPLGTTQTTPTLQARKIYACSFTTPPQTALGTNSTEPPPPPIRNKGPELGADNLTLEGVATERGRQSGMSVSQN
ncbi:hypothetical protein Tco_0521949 [Tanacetum coccineum]